MSVIRRHPVITFFLLTYALSWGAIPWQSFFAPGVLVAALIVVSLTEGVAGLKAMGSRLIRWRVSWIWYALALGVPLAIKFASIGLNNAFGAPAAHIAEFTVWYALPMAIAINIVNPINAQLPEEASFRGWAQPKLQTTRTPLAATALMALGVTIWHIPLTLMPQFVEPDRDPGHYRRNFLVRLVVQPRLGQCVAHADRACDRGRHRNQRSVAGHCRHHPDDVDRQPGLVRVRYRPVGLQPSVLDQPPAQVDDPDHTATKAVSGA